MSPTRHSIEYVDWATPILEKELKIEDGYASSPMQRGSGYPGMWELSDVTRWVNREASYVGRREAIPPQFSPLDPVE